MKIVTALLLQVIFLGLAFASLALLPYVQDRYMPVIELFPFGLASLLLILGIRFNRSQLVYGAVLLVAIYSYFFWFAATVSVAQHQFAVNSIGILFPLNVAIINFYSERGLLTLIGTLRILFIVIQVIALAWLIYAAYPMWQELVLQQVFPNLQLRLSILNQSAILAFLISSMIIIASNPMRSSSFHTALFGVTVLTVYALIQPVSELEQVALLISFAILFFLLTLLHESYRMAFLDELTNLPGRRALNETLHKLGSKYVIAMLDVDHFKRFNDKYGHDAGDDVLRLLSIRFTEVKGGGKPFRYGGEEFTIVFSGSSGEDAKKHLETLRVSIASKKFSLRKQERRAGSKKAKTRKSAATRNVSVTISIGYADRNKRNTSPRAVLKAADKALYRAKKKGRNQVSR